LVVGAPEHTVTGIGARTGWAQVYEFTGTAWQPFGDAQVGLAPDDLFGFSVSINSDGSIFAVGAPNDDSRWQDGGRIHPYQWTAPDFGGGNPVWNPAIDAASLTGDDEGYKFGTKIIMSSDGIRIVSSEVTADAENMQDAGRVVSSQIDFEFRIANTLGFGTPGTEPGQGFGHDVGFDGDGFVFVASTLNKGAETGLIRVYQYTNDGLWEQVGADINGLPLGGQQWYGNGPSVAMSKTGDIVAAGYESVLVDGVSRSVVRFFEYGPTAAGSPSQRMLRRVH
jgi:hypothetical protein